MGYNLLINGVYWGYNPLTNHLLTSWDIQVSRGEKIEIFETTTQQTFYHTSNHYLPWKPVPVENWRGDSDLVLPPSLEYKKYL